VGTSAAAEKKKKRAVASRSAISKGETSMNPSISSGKARRYGKVNSDGCKKASPGETPGNQTYGRGKDKFEKGKTRNKPARLWGKAPDNEKRRVR